MATFNFDTDMNKFSRNLETEIKDAARKQLEHETYEVECPKCGNVFKAPVGNSQCPVCNEDLNLKLDIKL